MGLLQNSHIPSLGRAKLLHFSEPLSFSLPKNAQSPSNTVRLALSIKVASSEARYICVTVSEWCPMPALMTDSGMFRLLATLAHEWRALYNADIFVEIDAIKIIDNNEYQ